MIAEELIILTSWHQGVALELVSKSTLALTRASEGDLLENSAMSKGASKKTQGTFTLP